MSREILFALALLAATACGSRAEAPGSQGPGPLGSPAASSATTSPTPAAVARATPKPNPTAGPGTYTSLALAYQVDLPAGWRRSACQSTRDVRQPPAVETFTSATPADELGTDIGSSQDIVLVRVDENPGGQGALAWLESGKLGFSTQSRFEKVAFDGNPDAARVVTSDGATTLALVVNARFRIYAISRELRTPTAAAEAAVRTIMTSLHVLRDAELAEAKATLAQPTLAPARSVEAVADALARGFSQRDTNLVAVVASDCFASAVEFAGGTFRPMAAALADIQNALARGLVVTVQARPIVDQTASSANLLGTWQDPGQAQRNVKFMLQKVGDTWYWFGTLYLQPIR